MKNKIKLKYDYSKNPNLPNYCYVAHSSSSNVVGHGSSIDIAAEDCARKGADLNESIVFFVLDEEDGEHYVCVSSVKELRDMYTKVSRIARQLHNLPAE